MKAKTTKEACDTLRQEFKFKIWERSNFNISREIFRMKERESLNEYFNKLFELVNQMNPMEIQLMIENCG